MIVEFEESIAGGWMARVAINDGLMCLAVFWYRDCRSLTECRNLFKKERKYYQRAKETQK